MAEEIESAEQRMIDFKCPYCGQGVSFPGMDAGTAQECPFCIQALIVPQESCEFGKKYPLPIITPRLTLRRLQPGDLDELVRLAGDEENLRYFHLHATDEEEITRWLEEDANARLNTLSPALYLAIELQEQAKLIGLTSIQYGLGNWPPPIISVLIDRAEQRKGYGGEAVRGILDFGFCGLNLRRITAFCDSRNEAFIGLAAKLGLRQEGAFFEDRYDGREWCNTAYFAMLKDEYQSVSQ